MSPRIAVVIATKNRYEDIQRHAFASLERSAFRDFVCVVWDASDDDRTRDSVQRKSLNFQCMYFKAPRRGSSSQRNDAVEYVLQTYTSVQYILFMDDDCEISPDTLDGILETFKMSDVSLVVLPIYPSSGEREAVWVSWVKRRLGWNHYGATDFLYNYKSSEGKPGGMAEWAGGSCIAADVNIFAKEGHFFPEEFQHFGGYALGEDFAFSFFLHKKKGKRIVNSLRGHFLHFPAKGARLNVAGMVASKWYNFHLLFDALYSNRHGRSLLWLKLKFKLFMVLAAFKCLIRTRSLNPLPALRGIKEARMALKEYHGTQDIKKLFCKRKRA